MSVQPALFFEPGPFPWLPGPAAGPKGPKIGQKSGAGFSILSSLRSAHKYGSMGSHGMPMGSATKRAQAPRRAHGGHAIVASRPESWFRASSMTNGAHVKIRLSCRKRASLGGQQHVADFSGLCCIVLCCRVCAVGCCRVLGFSRSAAPVTRSDCLNDRIPLQFCCFSLLTTLANVGRIYIWPKHQGCFCCSVLFSMCFGRTAVQAKRFKYLAPASSQRTVHMTRVYCCLTDTRV